MSISQLSDLELDLGYNSSESDLIASFYVPCLEAATSYDRAVGYFRSSIYHLVGIALSDFALRDGKIRLVCSPALESHDKAAILDPAKHYDAVEESLSHEVEALLEHPENRSVVELLATLILHEALTVMIAYKPGSSGIYHEKLGIFVDGMGESISFTGSANETFMAWDPAGNHEGFEVFTSWDETDVRRVRRHRQYFESLWNNEIPQLEVVPLPDVPRAVLDKYVNRDGVEAAIEKARGQLQRIGRTRASARRELQRHQQTVIDNWEAAGYRGIIDHVTGAGKTVSALEATRRWLATSDHVVIVVVPSDLLVQQWRAELDRELADLLPRILVIGGSTALTTARSSLNSFTAANARLGTRVVLSTMQSAAPEAFRERIVEGEHLMVVADEVHRVGAPSLRQLLEIASGARLGLSATPQRYGDPEGTSAIFEYFGDVLEPRFGISEAQAAGRLVPYDYRIGTVLLDEDESERYRDLTRRIAASLGRADDGSAIESDFTFRLRLQRASIIKSAAGKVPYAAALLRDQFQEGDHWLVYCENQAQLDAVREALDEEGIQSLEYYSAMLGSKPTTLRYFETYGGVLVSIKCLDEGVDIPRVDRALILASSSNPREYIQRRGRVLRTSPGKYSAEVFDVLVGIETSDGIEILRRDLERARAFAVTARNDSCRYDLDALDSTALDDESPEMEDDDGG